MAARIYYNDKLTHFGYASLVDNILDHIIGSFDAKVLRGDRAFIGDSRYLRQTRYTLMSRVERTKVSLFSMVPKHLAQHLTILSRTIFTAFDQGAYIRDFCINGALSAHRYRGRFLIMVSVDEALDQLATLSSTDIIAMTTRRHQSC